LRLSALLAEATSDPMYLEAAQQSAAFLHSHLFGSQGVIEESMGRVKDSCAVNSDLDPWNSGLMIEALAILISITPN
ncbi:hypothetical protein B0H13DRAFT_1519811, partial [Mycena leptocephala]